MKSRAWLVYLSVGAIALAVYLLVPEVRTGPVFNAIGLSSPIAIVVAVRLHRPEGRLPWYLFALGQTLFVVGDIITYNYDRIFDTELPFPSIGDVLYLSVYPCLIAGLLLLIRSRNPGRDRESAIDSLIVALGAGVVSWVFLMAPIAHDSGLTLVQRAVSMAYPLMDMIMIVAAVRLAVGAGRRPLAFSLMAASIVALFLTDSAYGWISIHGIVYDNGSGLLESGWGMFYLLWGAAALHPWMTDLSEPAPDQDPRLSRKRLALLAGASLIAPVMLFVEDKRGELTEVPVLVGASIALFLLVVARMAGLVRRQEQSATRERALREAGAALVTVTNREGIYRATLEAAATVAGGAAAVRVLVADGPEEEFRVVAAVGDEAAVQDRTMKLADLPDWKRDRLLMHRGIRAPVFDSEIATLLSMPAETQVVFTAPMFIKDELRALLSVGMDDVLPRVVCDGIEALASQVALALESAALTEDLLRTESEERFSSLVQHSSDVVTVVDLDTTVRWMSPSVQRVLGYAAGELEGSRLAELLHPDDRTRVLSFLSSAVGGRDAHPGLAEFRIRHRDESWRYVETLGTNLLDDPNVQGIVLNTRDISERKAFEEQLRHQAFHDPVTGLANRALFRDRVQHALERGRREEDPIAVLFTDIDDFKTINDSLGHAAGDLVLHDVGERLRACLRAADTAARFGGDEFAVLLEGGEGVRAADVAARILEALESPVSVEGKDVYVRASIGIATPRPGGEGAEELLRDADVAMYMAKESGKGHYQVFEPSMHDSALQRLDLKAGLQRAVQNEELILHYQPVIELGSGRIMGVEALVRWNHPVRGLVPPLEFIPLAEETGIIIGIGRWVLQEACRQAVLFQQLHPMDSPLHMAVNLSARQLHRPEILEEVAGALEETGLDPGSLILEITESVMMQDMDLSIRRLAELKELGVLLAVDDFGTGYSSLNYIRRFPVDILKVDKSFIDGVSESGEQSALTAAIIELAGILKLRPVAEGIERADQLERLLEMDCDLGQGFYFSKPLPTASLEELLQSRTALEKREREFSAGETGGG